MATLFLARRVGAAGFARPVAIKLVHPELADDEQFRQMFLDEALLASRIQHPNVVHVEQLAEHQGLHYLVMEFVHGCSLAQLIRALSARGRRLAPAFATRIAMHVADALHAAHETRDDRGRPLEVVHRDVSPENILLAYAGHVKLIDFGIAKAYGRRHKTQEGLLKGKFRYMSPEQAYGKPIDRRTDIYQLGIVLWEMLTQRRLFDADNDVDLLAQVRSPRIVPPGSLVDRVPPALDAAVMLALSNNPSRRPADAQTFARSLAKAVPSAHDVDGGALSGLLLGTMQDHRRREQATYPRGVYERLEQQIETLPLAGKPQALAEPAYQKYTLENTSPYGSDSPAEAKQALPRALPAGTQPGFASPGKGESERMREPGGVRDVERGPRGRRLVRLASELRTTFTAIEQGLGGRRGLWISIGAALGLALGLALITMVARRRIARPAPPPPGAAVQYAGERAERALPGGAGRELADAALAAPAAPATTRSPAVATAPERGDRPTPLKKLGPVRTIDGVPLIVEPGF